MGPTCICVGVYVYVRQRERMCVNVCDLPTLPQALSLMCVRGLAARGGPHVYRHTYCTCAAEGLVMQEKSLCSKLLSYIMCLLLQVMMQVIIMHGMRHQHLELDPGELLA